jgi:hypothetical protein
MEKGMSVGKWYWLLDLEVLVAALLGSEIVTVLLFPDAPFLLIGVGCLLGIVGNKARRYQQRVYDELSPDSRRPAKSFVLLWWVVVAIEAVWLTAHVIRLFTSSV